MADKPEDDIEDEDGEEGEGEEGSKKPGLKKLILFIGLPVIILLLGGIAGALFLFSGGDESQVVAEGEHGEAGQHGEARHSEPEHEPHFYVFSDPIMVNVNTDQGRSAMLMLELEIEAESEEVIAAITARESEIMDGYIGFLRELRTDDLMGSAGWHRLKLELLRRTNLAIAPAEADDVLIVNMAVN